MDREIIVEKFATIFEEEKSDMPEKIEESIYNYCLIKADESGLEFESPEIQELYFQKSRSIYENIHPESYFDNSELIDKIKSGKMNFDELVSLDSKQFRFKTLWKRIKQNQDILDKDLMDLKPTTETDQFLCKKCKQRRTTFFTMQIRSADEAETSFITCLNCGYSWREG